MNRKLRNILAGVGAVLIAGLACLLMNNISVVHHYNKGNSYYKNQNYVGAISQYESAAKGWLLGKKDCDIHVNKALAMLKKYGILDCDMDSLTGEQVLDFETEIEEVKAYLIENKCATADNKGHDEEAQQLYNDLCDFEDQLEQQQEQNSGNSGNSDNSGGSGDSGNSDGSGDSDGGSGDSDGGSGDSDGGSGDSDGGSGDSDGGSGNSGGSDNSENSDGSGSSGDDLEDKYRQEQEEGGSQRYGDTNGESGDWGYDGKCW